MPGHLQPLGVLIKHGIDNVNERFVAGEKSVPAGEEVTFEPTLTLVFAQHFHHSAVRRHVLIGRKNFRSRTSIGDLEDGVPSIGRGFVRAEHTESLRVELDKVTDKLPLNAGRLSYHSAGLWHRDG